jgi:predicted TIM-barrel fold metal-dependent hydrolase
MKNTTSEPSPHLEPDQSKRTLIKGALVSVGAMLADSLGTTFAQETRMQPPVEAALEPELQICDAHHHLWDRPGSRYLLDDLQRDTGGHNVTSSVFVECYSGYRTAGPIEERSLGETEYIEKLAVSWEQAASAKPRVQAIVSFADLMMGAKVEPILQAHRAASKRLRGIRHPTASEPSIKNSYRNPPLHRLTDATFREGFALLRKYDLSFDAWLYHPQITELADLANAFPDTVIIMDHIGAPLGIEDYAGKRAEVFKDWKASIDKIAKCPNVVVKLGGLGMPLCGMGWVGKPPTSSELAQATAPYYSYVIEKFGVQRCMFESNFPVDNASYPYVTLWNSFKLMTKSYSKAERAALFHDTAAKVYRLV